MAHRLIQYRIAAAAVSDSFIPWVQAHASDVIEGHSPVVATGHAQQIGNLKGKILAHDITAMGIEWQTAAGLRRLLCQSIGVPFEPLGRENLELLIRIAAAQMDGPLAATLAADPSDALKAMDELGRSGRMPKDWGNVLPGGFSQLGQRLEQTGEWLPAQEWNCLQQAQKSLVQLGSVFLFGWGGNHYPDLGLISILRYVTDDLTILVPQPRLLGGEDLEERWILELEQLLGVVSEIAQDPEDWSSLHEGFASSLVMEEPVADAVLPEVRVGQTVADQACLVVDWVELQEDLLQQLEPLGCLVSGEGGSLYRLAEEFSRRGIIYHQEIGEVLSAGGFHTFHKLLIRCFSTHADIEEVLKLLEWLLARNESCVAGLKYQSLRDLCIRRFNQTQSRNFSELWSEAASDSQSDLHEAALARFAKWLQPWPDQIRWDEARQRWVQVATHFGFGADYLEPVWSRLSGHLAGQIFASRYFFEYVESLLGAPGLWRDECAVAPYARVIITTQAAAMGRSWGALAFMDSQEGVWPATVTENPFLRDNRREELNRNRPPGVSRLLTMADRARQQHQGVLELMENCSGPILFSGSLTDGRAPEVKTFPNEWAAKVLLSGQQDALAALKRWEAAGETVATVPAAFQVDDRVTLDLGRFQQVHEKRSDPNADIGAHEFLFSASIESFQRPLGASGLDGMMAAPASFAMERLFGAAPRDLADFMRKEAMLLGVWTHATLAYILNQRIHTSVDQIIENYRPVAAEMPGLWMQVLAEKASWMVRACLLEVQQLGGEWQVDGVEWKPENIALPTPAGELVLSGRLDLILKSDSGEQLIIDFKTGKTGEVPTPKTLKTKATGLQYVAYLLLMENGSETRRVRVINPFKSQDRELTLEHMEGAQEHLEALARMIHTKTFPRRGPLRDEYGFSAEVLPLTSLAIDEEVLEEKWQSFLQGGTTS